MWHEFPLVINNPHFFFTSKFEWFVLTAALYAVMTIFMLLTMPDCFSIDLIKAWVANCPNQRLGGLCKVCLKYHTANRCTHVVFSLWADEKSISFALAYGTLFTYVGKTHVHFT